MSLERRERILELDVLRAGGILAVVALHALGHIYPTGYAGGLLAAVARPGTYVALGGLFFVSGFTMSITDSGFRSPREAVAFVAGRLTRIYPLYLVAVTLFLALWVRPVTVQNVVAHVLLVQMWLVPIIGATAQTLWFVSVLFLFYFCFVVFTYRMGSTGELVLRMAVVFAILFSVQEAARIGDVRILLYYPAFCMGVLSQRLRWIPGRKTGFVLLSAALVLVTSFLLDSILSAESTLSRGAAVVLSTSGVVLIWLLAERLLRAPGFRAPVLATSYASFGMYLFHRPVFAAMQSLWSPETLAGRYALYSIGAAVVFGVGYATQRAHDALWAQSRSTTDEQPGDNSRVQAEESA